MLEFPSAIMFGVDFHCKFNSKPTVCRVSGKNGMIFNKKWYDFQRESVWFSTKNGIISNELFLYEVYNVNTF